VKNEGYYQIGKNYFEPLSLIQFDEASQELIQFLWRVIPDGDHLDVDYILPNHGRNLSLTSGTFEEGINLFNDLYDFSFEHNHQTYGQLIFRPLSGLEDLIQFKVVVHRQSIELIISEKEYQPLFNNAFLFTNGFIYSLNLKQQKILTAILSLPIEADLAKHLFFDLDDQAKLAASLLDFKELGKVEAPKSFDIRDFKVTFYLELNEYREVALHVSFDYGNVIVHSKRELEELPFASHFKHEEKVFRTLETNGFSASFLSYHAPLADKDLYDFFTRTLGQLARLGQVTLSDELEEMRQFEEPQVSVHTKGGLLDISFDFSTVFENDIDGALEALFKNQPYFVNGSGKLVVFDEETQRVSSTLQNLRAKQLDNGHLQLDAISAFQISDLFQG
ncbi:MAG: SNF2 helicase associated domain-containing protein, partial [Streptococcus lutetiensis]|nr:SNF2 helicase associated domain-containing protein [Streptococcus lutetiensis]